MMLLLFCVVLLAFHSAISQPQQIHLSIYNNTNDVLVTWLTAGNFNDSLVKYTGTTKTRYQKIRENELFNEVGPYGYPYYMYTAVLENLNRNETYTYIVGSTSDGWSSRYSFYIPPTSKSPTVIALFGDIHTSNCRYLSNLQQEAQVLKYDAVIHTGVFIESLNYSQDHVMNSIQPISAYVPFMVAPGAHEETVTINNTSVHKTRFKMPGTDNQTVSSFNIGKAHFITFATDHWLKNNTNDLEKMYNLIEQDLKAANELKTRQQTPWIIVYGHTPPYCSPYDNCPDTSALKTGAKFNNETKFSLEKLYNMYDVDLGVWGLSSGLTRFQPILNNAINGTSISGVYTNPIFTVHVTSSLMTQTSPQTKVNSSWVAFNNKTETIMKLTIYNSTHIQLLSVDINNVTVDDAWIVKHKHGSATLNCATTITAIVTLPILILHLILSN